MKSSSHISVATVEEKNRIDSDIPFLAAVEIDVTESNGTLIETLYLVNNNEDIVFNGQTYTAFPFTPDLRSESGEESSVTLTIQDLTGDIKQRMEGYGGGVGFVVRLMVINTGNLDGDPEIVETFRVISADVDDYVVKWTLGTESHLALAFPRRRQIKSRCSWAYKSVECGYSGVMESCDYTLDGPNGCSAHDNNLNFGGFPGINQY